MSLQTSASADVVYYIFATIPSSSHRHHGSSSNILAFGISFWVLVVTMAVSGLDPKTMGYRLDQDCPHHSRSCPDRF
jgi:hypothetical protein